MEWYGHVQNGQLRYTPEVQTRRARYLGKLKDGTIVKERLVRQGSPKSRQQLGCHFGLVVGMIRDELAENGIDLATFLAALAGYDARATNSRIAPGIPVSREVIAAALYAYNDVGDDGERKRISEMNTIEMSRFFENCRNAVAQWSIVQLQIPDPDPNWNRNTQAVRNRDVSVDAETAKRC